MKKTLIIALLAFLCHFQATSQEVKKDRIKAYKTAYLTQQLDLSVKEAEKFWPVYNEYDKKLFILKVEKVRKEKHRIRQLGGPDSLSENDAEEIVFSMLKTEKEASLTRENMYQELSKVLGPKKLLKLYQAEMNFNKRLLIDYKKRNTMRDK